jgi:hypothetical protein
MGRREEQTGPRYDIYTDRMDQTAGPEMQPAAPVALLRENHRAFLRYLERKLGDPAAAEDTAARAVEAFARELDTRAMSV